MPIYDYKCSLCGKEEERLVTFSNSTEQTCKCDEEAEMVIVDNVNPLNFKLKGRWYKNGGY